MRTQIAVNSLILVLSLTACGGPAPPPPSSSVSKAVAAKPDPPFVGKFWMSTTPGMPLGSMMLFLPDRTLLMTSCVETYRLSKWEVTGERMRWIEETIPIEGIVSMPRPNELVLEIAGRDRVQSYRLASVPYVCPDMPK